VRIVIIGCCFGMLLPAGCSRAFCLVALPCCCLLFVTDGVCAHHTQEELRGPFCQAGPANKCCCSHSTWRVCRPVYGGCCRRRTCESHARHVLHPVPRCAACSVPCVPFTPTRVFPSHSPGLSTRVCVKAIPWPLCATRCWASVCWLWTARHSTAHNACRKHVVCVIAAQACLMVSGCTNNWGSC
jgi:hypothetical protein